MSEPRTEAGRALLGGLKHYAMPLGGEYVPLDQESGAEYILAIEQQAASAERERPLIQAALRYYANTMPGYAAAAGLTQDEYAAVMVDVKAVRALIEGAPDVI